MTYLHCLKLSHDLEVAAQSFFFVLRSHGQLLVPCNYLNAVLPVILSDTRLNILKPYLVLKAVVSALWPISTALIAVCIF